MKISKKFLLLFLVILIVGVGRHLYYAWRLKGYLDGDCATVILMTDDILHGRFNTFFYGQDYSGTFDSFWLLPFVYIFGLNISIVFLGIIAQYIAYLFTVYKLGTLIKNRYIGILAFTYCAIAPYPLLNSSVFPYGYHINIMILGNLILIFTLLIDIRENNIWMWILLGLCAGLGFWNHYIILYYLVPSAVFLLIPPRCSIGAGFTKGIFKRFKYYFLAIFSFFIGGFPFWKYNIQTGFPSLTSRYRKVYVYEESFSASFWPAVKKLFGYHIQGLLGAGRINMSAFFIWGIFIIAFIVFFIKPDRKKFLLILFLCSFFGFSLSHGYFVMADKYYFFLPLYTFISICFGYFIYWAYGNKRYLGVGLCLFVLLFNFRDFTLSTYNWRPDKKDIGVYNYRNTAYKGLIEFLYSNKINSVISDFVTVQGINFMTNKRILGAEFRDGRVPIDESAQARDRLALIERSGEIRYSDYLISTLNVICKSYKTAQLFDYKIIYDFNKYGYYGRSVDAKNWKAYANYNREDTLHGFDRNLDKYWSSKKGKNPDMYYDLDLGKEYSFYKLVVINKIPILDNLPSGYKIEVSYDGKNWNLLKESYGPEPLFWSGPRIYWDYRDGRWEVIFKPIKARYIRIKNTDFGGHPWIINELYVYEYLGQEDYKLRDYVKPARQVYRYLIKKKIKFAYADFWLSAKIGKWSNNKIGSLQVENMCYPLRKNTSRVMKIDSDTSIIINSEMQEETEKVLKEFNLPIEKKIISDYICYLFTQSGEKPLGFKWQNYFLKYQDSLYWAGVMPVKKSFKSYSQVLYGYGLKLEREGDLENAINYYKRALEVYPRNYLAREALVSYCRENEQVTEYKKELLKLKHLLPNVKKIIEFKNGATFLGYRMFRYNNQLRIDYYWKASRKLTDYTVCFIHFIKNKRIAFQGDYPLPFEYPNKVIRLKDWTFVERSRVKIPVDIEQGEYEIQIGLYAPYKSGKRVKTRIKDTKVVIGKIKL